MDPNIFGLYGSPNLNASNCKQFDSQKWLNENKLDRLVGIVFYHQNYLEGIQFQGVRFQDNGEEKITCDGKESIFLLFVFINFVMY